MKHLILSTFVLLLTFNAQAQLADEVIVDSAETGRAWNAEIVQSHEVWKKPACSAYTMSEDGQSTLEVVAYYNAAADRFSEPEVNIVTVANFNFLDATTTTDGTPRNFVLLPVQPQDTTLVGARALFGEREDLVVALRRHNRVTVRYMDVAGEVKSLQFSLRGSSAAIQAAFQRCGLEFLPDLQLPEPL